MRGDAGHRKGRATRSESSEKTQSLSPLGRVGGRQQALEMTHIAPGSTCGLLPTRRDPGAIPMGHYHQDLVLHGGAFFWCRSPIRNLQRHLASKKSKLFEFPVQLDLSSASPAPASAWAFFYPSDSAH